MKKRIALKVIKNPLLFHRISTVNNAVGRWNKMMNRAVSKFEESAKNAGKSMEVVSKATKILSDSVKNMDYKMLRVFKEYV